MIVAGGGGWGGEKQSIRMRDEEDKRGRINSDESVYSDEGEKLLGFAR